MKLNMIVGRVSLIALCAMSQSACAGKLYYGSELGQAGASGLAGLAGASGSDGISGAGAAGPAAPAGQPGAQGAVGAQGAAGAQGATGATGAPGNLLGANGALGGGLGITGTGGAISNLTGSDPVGGVLTGVLGSNNGVSQITGTPAGSTSPGLVPRLASMAKTGAGTPVLGSGLGITGSGGLVGDVIGNDSVGGVTGESGVIGASIAGGNDGLLGNVLSNNAPLLLPAAGDLVNQAGTAKTIVSSQGLGVSGASGLGQALVGTDAVGNLVGTSGGTVPTVLDTSSALSGVLPNAKPPLGVVGTTVNGVLGAVAGTSPSPVAGLTSTTGSTALGNVLSAVAGTTASPSNTLTGVVNNLTGTVGGSGLSGVLGGLAGH